MEMKEFYRNTHIGSRVWQDLEPYVDMATWEDLQPVIRYGLANSSLQPNWGRHFGLNPTVKNLWEAREEYFSESPESPIRRAGAKLESDPVKFHRFLKLHYKGFEAFDYLSLRKYTGDEWWMRRYSRFCEWTPEIHQFPGLQQFLESLPLAELGRVTLIVNRPFCDVEVHADRKPEQDHFDHFIHLTPDYRDKQFFLYDTEKCEEIPVNSNAIFFNHAAYHGVHCKGHRSYSIKVDGVFSDELLQKMNLRSLENFSRQVSP